MTKDEVKFIGEASAFLENPGFLMKLANQMGKPLEKLQERLPDRARTALVTTTHRALEQALKTAISTIPKGKGAAPREVKRHQSLHTLGSALTGGVGGFFGFVSLPIELPVTTALLLRSIIQTAQDFGFDITSPDIQFECLYIFELGTSSPEDDATETAYYTSRLGFGQLMHQASKYLAKHSIKEVLGALEKGTAPVLLKIIARIAARFEVAVSEKVVSQSVPIIGALGGAAINVAFSNYFNQAAKFHFGIRQLEEKYGAQKVRNLYLQASKPARK